MSDVILNDAGITPVEGEVVALEYEPTHITGLRFKSGEIIKSRAVVITTGTFLNGLCHVGEEQFKGGR